MRKLDPDSFVKRGPHHMKRKRLERLAREAHGEASSSSPKPATPPRTEAPAPLARFIVYSDARRVPSPPRSGDNDTEDSDENENDLGQFSPLSDVVCEENGEQLPSRPTAAPRDMSDAATILRNTVLPGLHALSQLLNNIDTSNVLLDEPTYGLFIQGMGSAALLERQLSRMTSRAV